MHYPVITISREYGSGGRAIGERLAKELGVPFYDKELIFMAAKESGLSEEYIKKTKQMKSTSFLYGLYMSAQQLPMNDQIFLVQSKIIRQVAQEGPCVIVGRCATNILKDKSLKIFIHAPFEERVQNVIRRTGREEASARKLVKKMDKERKAYYEYFTDSKWLDMTQYDLCIDSSRFSMEQIVEIVKRCL